MTPSVLQRTIYKTTTQPGRTKNRNKAKIGHNDSMAENRLITNQIAKTTKARNNMMMNISALSTIISISDLITNSTSKKGRKIMNRIISIRLFNLSRSPSFFGSTFFDLDSAELPAFVFFFKFLLSISRNSFDLHADHCPDRSTWSFSDHIHYPTIFLPDGGDDDYCSPIHSFHQFRYPLGHRSDRAEFREKPSECRGALQNGLAHDAALPAIRPGNLDPDTKETNTILKDAIFQNVQQKIKNIFMLHYRTGK